MSTLITPNISSLVLLGIGTHLVTCQKQPALGCVYKLVEIHGVPRIKLSEEIEKVTLPCRKNVFRLWNDNSESPVGDVIQGCDEPAPEVGVQLLFRHPFIESVRSSIVPTKVESLINLVWDGENGIVSGSVGTLLECRAKCISEVKTFNPDHLRNLGPTKYKVEVSDRMYDYFHELWHRETAFAEV